ncbi:hypothetical protein GCM10009104_13390 [Marinobacterium maritimum]|uniref:Uncharacterized protein n=1 Tax=Marinobacterium maritimum TaxID=500162 RepID=A0ABP3TAN0_9GAMM
MQNETDIDRNKLREDIDIGLSIFLIAFYHEKARTYENNLNIISNKTNPTKKK